MAHKFANNVLETSVTAGNGDLTLAGAVPSYLSFASEMAVGDTCMYFIAEVDTVGRPTGLREWGIGTFATGNKLTRTTVIGPTANTRVAFTDATKMVGMAILAPAGGALAAWRVGLGIDKVDNTPDAQKPISDPVRAALDALENAAWEAIGLKADRATTVEKDSNTGAARIPAGTTSQRGTPDEGAFRFNKDTKRGEMGNGTAFVSLGGATGGGNDAVFYLNSKLVTSSFTVPAGQNAQSAGPIEIADGATVTVADGSTWVIA